MLVHAKVKYIEVQKIDYTHYKHWVESGFNLQKEKVKRIGDLITFQSPSELSWLQEILGWSVLYSSRKRFPKISNNNGKPSVAGGILWIPWYRLGSFRITFCGQSLEQRKMFMPSRI